VRKGQNWKERREKGAELEDKMCKRGRTGRSDVRKGQNWKIRREKGAELEGKMCKRGRTGR
jgi:hypothetical protein